MKRKGEFYKGYDRENLVQRMFENWDITLFKDNLRFLMTLKEVAGEAILAFLYRHCSYNNKKNKKKSCINSYND